MTREQEQELSDWLRENLTVDVDWDQDLDGKINRVRVTLNVWDPATMTFIPVDL